LPLAEAPGIGLTPIVISLSMALKSLLITLWISRLYSVDYPVNKLWMALWISLSTGYPQLIHM
jgi:hypothetical protein